MPACESVWIIRLHKPSVFLRFMLCERYTLFPFFLYPYFYANPLSLCIYLWMNLLDWQWRSSASSVSASSVGRCGPRGFKLLKHSQSIQLENLHLHAFCFRKVEQLSFKCKICHACVTLHKFSLISENVANVHWLPEELWMSVFNLWIVTSPNIILANAVVGCAKLI